MFNTPDFTLGFPLNLFNFFNIKRTTRYNDCVVVSCLVVLNPLKVFNLRYVVSDVVFDVVFWHTIFRLNDNGNTHQVFRNNLLVLVCNNCKMYVTAKCCLVLRWKNHFVSAFDFVKGSYDSVILWVVKKLLVLM